MIGVKSKPFTLSRSICQSSLLSSIIYIFALVPFVCKLKAKLSHAVLHYPVQSLKGRTEVCGSHIVLYQLSVLSLPWTVVVNLERLLFQFIWGKRAPFVRGKICYLCLSEGGLGISNVKPQSSRSNMGTT